jgi:hypothetical protein
MQNLCCQTKSAAALIIRKNPIAWQKAAAGMTMAVSQVGFLAFTHLMSPLAPLQHFPMAP